MGRIKTKLIKRMTTELVGRHGADLQDDFSKNKRLVNKYIDVPSKKIQNTIAGYVTRLIKKRKAEQ